MKKEYHSWHSPILGLTLPVISYGHWGAPLIMFPTAAADCEEYERFGLIDSISHHIEGGKIKIYSVESINQHIWMNKEIHPSERARRQTLYDAYICQEVARFIEENCNTPGISIGTSGASFGAFHALNTLLKHPDRFRLTISMSGAYDIKHYADGFYDDNVYFNNPVDYLPNLNDSHFLNLLQGCNINILTGQGAWENPQHSRRISTILEEKGIPHNLDLWGYDWPHDWPTWKVQLNQYIERLF